jgi:methionyl-tRNA synthetase
LARHLITSALPYINGVKHLGNLVGSMLPSDVYARYLRQTGNEVLLICATDEHGTPAELAARDAGLSVAEFCRQQHDRQRVTVDGFQLSFDHFGRSSSPQNHALTKRFAADLTANGYIEERVTDQVYSLDDDRFLPDRYIIGTCPNCGYGAARGDQCENCTKLLDPTDLIEPRSAISGGTRLEVRPTRHLYLLQSKLAPEIRQWVDKTSPQWPLLSSSIAYKWLDEGLGDRSITRDLEWGVAVDRPGFEGKVFYVWFDAPIEYIGATAEWADLDPGNRSWERWWLTDRGAADVTYTEFMAKDNIPFHTINFPASELGTREPWRLVDVVKGFNWLTYYGGKFSTSQQRGVFMDAALELCPSDVWRWFLVANAPETSDADFTWELFQSVVNKDLAGNLGNFVNRTLTLATRHFGEVVPAGGETGEAEVALAGDLSAGLATYTANVADLQFRKAANQLRSIWSLGNSYLERTAPWKQVKVDREAAAATLRTAVNLARIFAVVSSPVIPSTAGAILEALGRAGDETGWIGPEDAEAALTALTPGSTVSVPPILFAKVADEDVAAWRLRFGA